MGVGSGPWPLASGVEEEGEGDGVCECGPVLRGCLGGRAPSAGSGLPGPCFGTFFCCRHWGLSAGLHLKALSFHIYVFILRERESGGGAERGRERESQAGSVLSAQSPTWTLASVHTVSFLLVLNTHRVGVSSELVW